MQGDCLKLTGPINHSWSEYDKSVVRSVKPYSGLTFQLPACYCTSTVLPAYLMFYMLLVWLAKPHSWYPIDFLFFFLFSASARFFVDLVLSHRLTDRNRLNCIQLRSTQWCLLKYQKNTKIDTFSVIPHFKIIFPHREWMEPMQLFLPSLLWPLSPLTPFNWFEPFKLHSTQFNIVIQAIAFLINQIDTFWGIPHFLIISQIIFYPIENECSC